MESLAPASLFVNRASELATFDRLIERLSAGLRSHLALFGLRRIGKSLLLDEVQRRHPQLVIARLDVDAVVATPEDFARALVAETLHGVLRARGDRRYVGETDEALRTIVSMLVPALLPMLEDLLVAVTAPTFGRLLNTVLRFPGAVSDALSPLDEGARQLHAAVYAAAAAIRESLQKHQYLPGASAKRARELARWYRLMNWQSDRQLEALVAELESMASRPGAKRKPEVGPLDQVLGDIIEICYADARALAEPHRMGALEL